MKTIRLFTCLLLLAGCGQDDAAGSSAVDDTKRADMGGKNTQADADQTQVDAAQKMMDASQVQVDASQTMTDASMTDAAPALDASMTDAAQEVDASTADAAMPLDTKSVMSFGARCDGKADDTAALQRAFDSGEDISFPVSSVCRITKQIDIDQAGDQVVVGNGATIITTTSVKTALLLDKKTGLLTVNELSFDGRRKTTRGWWLKSAFLFNQVNVSNIYHDGGNAIGYFLEVDGAWSHAEINNSVCDSIESKGDSKGNIGDPLGIARCIQLYWDVKDVPVTVKINESTLGNVWGDDGDVIENIHRLNDYDSPARLEVRNTKIFNASRRLVKNRASNTYWENVTFTSADPDNPNLTGTKTAGMLSMFRYTANRYTNRHVFHRCTFNGSGLENRFIISWVDDILIDNCTFNDADFALYKRGGGVCFQNNTVDDKFAIFSYGGTVDYSGTVVETGTTPSKDHIKLSSVPSPTKDFECPRPVKKP